MTTFEKLAKRIKDELDIEVVTSSLHRTYAGYWLRAAGAFVWEGDVCGYPSLKIGSITPATQLLKEERLAIVEDRYNEIEIIGENK